jgi:hypothetical protein
MKKVTVFVLRFIQRRVCRLNHLLAEEIERFDGYQPFNGVQTDQTNEQCYNDYWQANLRGMHVHDYYFHYPDKFLIREIPKSIH